MTTDAAYLRLAARHAWRGYGRTAPNPIVGCVVVSRDGRVIGLGHHRAFGGPHAEIDALAACARRSADPRGATVYVTLEPCAHTGKTPPCARALERAGVAEVIAAAPDPGKDSGGGFAILEAAGIRTRFLAEPTALRSIAPFLKRERLGLPFLTCKWAQTIDGFVATRTGESQWIGGERSRRFTHRLRGRVDAVLIGSGTLRADNPRLTARGVRVRRRALRVVLDSSLSIPASSNLALSVSDGPVIVFCAHELTEGDHAATLRRLGVTVVGVGRSASGGLDLPAALAWLTREHRVMHVLSEAGPALTGAFVREGLADELLVMTGPTLFADPGARSALHIGELTSIAAAPRWSLSQVRRIENDVMSVYSPAPSGSDGTLK